MRSSDSARGAPVAPVTATIIRFCREAELRFLLWPVDNELAFRQDLSTKWNFGRARDEIWGIVWMVKRLHEASRDANWVELRNMSVKGHSTKKRCDTR